MEQRISVKEFARLFVQVLWDAGSGTPGKGEIAARAAAIAELLGRHFNLKTVEWLGSGAYGAAARMPDGKAIKLTTDEREVDAGVFLAGKDLPHVARIESAAMTRIKVYNGMEERDLSVGVIVLEALAWTGLPNPALRIELNTLIDEVGSLYKVYLWDVRHLSEEEAMTRLEGASKHLLGVLEASPHPEFRQMAAGLRELHKVKLWAVDLHDQNMGWSRKDSVYKLFDLGLWPRQERPVLEGRRA